MTKIVDIEYRKQISINKEIIETIKHTNDYCTFNTSMKIVLDDKEGSH